MKNIATILFTLCATFFSLQIHASENLDSLSFDFQRQKVNKLLDERTTKFGQYDISLEQKTGVFGLFKSKKDMQNSINILQEIIRNDNKILIETKKLINIKGNESEKHQRLAKEYDDKLTAYMKTITTLQIENDKLRQEINSLANQDHNGNRIIYIMSFIFLGLLYIIYKLTKRLKAKNVTKV